MADNVTVNEGSSKAIAADDISSVWHQRVKIEHGADGSATDVSTASPLPVRQMGGGGGGPTQITSSATSAQFHAATGDRRAYIVSNDSTATLYLKYGTTASATSYTVKIPPGGYWEMPQGIWVGRIDGVWSAANGFAYVTEVTG